MSAIDRSFRSSESISYTEHQVVRQMEIAELIANLKVG